MVTIKVGDDLLFSSTLAALKYVVQDICLRKELNQADTLEMVVPDINIRKSLLQVGTKEITLWVNNTRKFRGRLITKGMDFDKSLRIYCEGELAYLRDVTVRPYTSSDETAEDYFEDMLDAYNALIDAADSGITGTPSAHKKFVKGTVSPALASATDTRGNEDYPTYYDELMEWLVNQYGGYIIPRYDNGVNKLDYVTDKGDGAQSVVYGKNLLGYKNDSDYTPLYTRIIAIGSKPDSSGGGGGDTPTPVGNEEVPSPGENEVPQPGENEAPSPGENELEEEVPSPGENESVETPSAGETPSTGNDDTPPPVAIVTAETSVLQQYGLKEIVKNYDECTTVSQLEQAALADLADGITFIPQLEINALDMANFDASEPFDIGKKYRLISPAHGYTSSSDKVLLVRMEEYPLQPERNVYTFGAVSNGLTQETAQTNRSMNAVAKLAVNTAAQAAELLDKIQTLEDSVEGMTDFVEETTTSGDWTVRTWHSAKKEAWATTAVSNLSFTNNEATTTINLPTGAPTGGMLIITGDHSAVYTGNISNGVLTVTINSATAFASATLNILIMGA